VEDHDLDDTRDAIAELLRRNVCSRISARNSPTSSSAVPGTTEHGPSGPQAFPAGPLRDAVGSLCFGELLCSVVRIRR
jgi:hypothetical protein